MYGSLRERSYSRFLTLEAERLLRYLGAETRVFDPHGLPLPDGAPVDHPKVAELRELSAWSEGQVRHSRTPLGVTTSGRFNDGVAVLLQKFEGIESQKRVVLGDKNGRMVDTFFLGHAIQRAVHDKVQVF